MTDTDNSRQITALIDRRNKVLMDWSTKAGCTVLTKMFFRKIGILDEALAYNPWIHEYRMYVFFPANLVTIDDFRDTGLYRFKVVRNPFARAVSSYIRVMKDDYLQEDVRRLSWRRNADISFARFIDYLDTLDLRKCDPHQAYQKKFFEFELGKCFDRVIKLEELENGIAVINRETGLGFDLTGLTSHHHHNISTAEEENVASRNWSKVKNKIPTYPHFYTEELASRIRKIYAEDFDAYGYGWEEFVAGYSE